MFELPPYSTGNLEGSIALAVSRRIYSCFAAAAPLARNDPTFANLAIWVEAGGDPDYAMKYILTPPKAADPNGPSAAKD